MYMPVQHPQPTVATPTPAYSIPMHPPGPSHSAPLSHDYLMPTMAYEQPPVSLPLTQHLPVNQAPSDPFRFNDFHFRQEYNDPNAASILACQTNIFRK